MLFTIRFFKIKLENAANALLGVYKLYKVNFPHYFMCMFSLWVFHACSACIISCISFVLSKFAISHIFLRLMCIYKKKHWILSRFEILPDVTSLLLFSRFVTFILSPDVAHLCKEVTSVHLAQLSHTSFYWLPCCFLCNEQFRCCIFHEKWKQFARRSNLVSQFSN